MSSKPCNRETTVLLKSPKGQPAQITVSCGKFDNHVPKRHEVSVELPVIIPLPEGSYRSTDETATITFRWDDES